MNYSLCFPFLWDTFLCFFCCLDTIISFCFIPCFSEGVYLWLSYFFSFSFVFHYFFSFLSLLFIFCFSGSFVLVQVIQVMGFYRVFIIKNKGEWGVCIRGK